MNESYGKSWVDVRLMVNDSGEVHCVGGQRTGDDADYPYIGAERLQKFWGVELGRCPKPDQPKQTEGNQSSAIVEMNKAVRCLACQVPESVYEDVKQRWDAVVAQHLQ